MENSEVIRQEDLVRAIRGFRHRKFDFAKFSRGLRALAEMQVECEEFVDFVGRCATVFYSREGRSLSVEEAMMPVVDAGLMVGIQIVLNRPEGFGLRHESRGTASGAKFSRLSKGGARKAGKPADGRRAGTGLAK